MSVQRDEKWQSIVRKLPKSAVKYGQKVVKYLVSGKTLSVTDEDELEYKGVVVPNSNVFELIRYLFHKKSGRIPAGFREFYRIIKKRVKIPDKIVREKRFKRKLEEGDKWRPPGLIRGKK